MQNAFLEKYEGREIGLGAPGTEVVPPTSVRRRVDDPPRADGAQSGAVVEAREGRGAPGLELGETGVQRAGRERRGLAGGEQPAGPRLARRQVRPSSAGVSLPAWVYNSLVPEARPKVRLYSSHHSDGGRVFWKLRVHGYFVVREGDEDSQERRQQAAQALADGLQRYLESMGFEGGGGVAFFTPWVTASSFNEYYPGVDFQSDPARVPGEHLGRWLTAIHFAFSRPLYDGSSMHATDAFVDIEAASVLVGPGYPGFGEGAVTPRSARLPPPDRREPEPAGGGAGSLARRQPGTSPGQVA